MKRYEYLFHTFMGYAYALINQSQPIEARQFFLIASYLTILFVGIESLRRIRGEAAPEV